MAPLREEEKKVEKDIQRIRKMNYDKEMSKYRKMFKEVYKVVPITEKTSWKPSGTDPRRIYQRLSSDHWAKGRVQADREVAVFRLRGRSSSRAEDSCPGQTSGSRPFVWSSDKAKVLENPPFPDLVRHSLLPELPGALSRFSSKSYNKANPRWPENEFRRRILDPNYKSWFYQEVTANIYKPTKDRNQLPI